jgi:DNA-binding transcriptional MocR family regulator
MVAALRKAVPDAELSAPHGGLFAWVRLPDVATRELLPIALETGVEFAPGDQFFAEPQHGEQHLRLNFATHTPADIRLGIDRLAAALRRAG